MKILLATDGSKYSHVALENLAQMPHSPNTEICIISVYENISAIAHVPGSIVGVGNYNEEASNIARKTAEEAAQFLKKTCTGLSISSKVVIGLPQEAILNQAESFNADLIVVGSHGKGALSRLLLGSVSQTLALHAPCSVLIVREKEMELKNQF